MATNLLEIAKKAGAALIRDAIPGGALIIDALNAALPADKQLPPDTTGDTLAARLSQLELQANTTVAMLNAEAQSTHTTRPRIALGAFHVVATVTLTVIAMWAVAIARGDVAMLGAITGGWEFVLAAIVPFVGWLNQYFGILRDEHKNRLDAVNGAAPPRGLAAIVAAFKK
jgi:hypothetical protein